jgi:hypothetical protein
VCHFTDWDKLPKHRVKTAQSSRVDTLPKIWRKAEIARAAHLDGASLPRFPARVAGEQRARLSSPLALFGHVAISELGLLPGVKGKLDFEPAKGSFWR